MFILHVFNIQTFKYICYHVFLGEMFGKGVRPWVRIFLNDFLILNLFFFYFNLIYFLPPKVKENEQVN